MSAASPSQSRWTALSAPLDRAVGAKTAQALATLGLHTTGDLLRHYPRRYAMPGELSTLSELRKGDHVTVMAQVREVTIRTMHSRGGSILSAVVTDGTSSLDLTFFAKRAGMLRSHESKLVAGRRGLFSGVVGEYRGRMQLAHPDYVLVGVDAEDDESALAEASRPIPLYPATASLPSWRIARAVSTVLDPLVEGDIPDPIPEDMRKRDGLLDVIDGLHAIHRPRNKQDIADADKRFIAEEAWVLQVALAQRRAVAQAEAAPSLVGKSGTLRQSFDERLPFALTQGQQQVGAEIDGELAATIPMLRLLQGDVGSGKTVVALRAMLTAVDSGMQAVLLAPTEVLATQHYQSIRDLLGPLGEGGMLTAATDATRVVLLTGSMSMPAKRAALGEIAGGAAGIVIGTHAVLSDHVQFAALGLVVVDEQHRFGVEQRDALRGKAAVVPHTLVMTATPIPRTLAMTVFGDLEVSSLRELPAGRQTIATHVVPAENPAWMQRLWTRVAEEIAKGGRVFMVCPRIDEDDTDAPDEADLGEWLDADELKKPRKPLVSVAAMMRTVAERAELAGVSAVAMHGRMSAAEKDEAMARFISGAAPVMVATTVIEVGVNVPAATAMIVFDAERFGLAQLHQLRGRVGRGDKAAVCLLVTNAPPGSLAEERLRAVEVTTDGFELAEADLTLRKEGDVLGARQSGVGSQLRKLVVMRDMEAIEKARDAARDYVHADPTLSQYPELAYTVSAWLDEDTQEFLEKA